MHELSHQRDAVLAHLKNTMRVLREDHPKTQRVGIKALALPNNSQWQMRPSTDPVWAWNIFARTGAWPTQSLFLSPARSKSAAAGAGH